MILSWFFSSAFASTDHVRVSLPVLILWVLWKVRNQACFVGAPFEASQVIAMIDRFVEQLGREKIFSESSFKGDRGGGQQVTLSS